MFARVLPDQKEILITCLNAAGVCVFRRMCVIFMRSFTATLSGHTTLMCGDGTNDVGALKQAHVGKSSPAVV